MERIVITGMGAVSPLGLNVAESWKNAIAGVSGVGPITQFDHARMQVHIAAEVKGFDPSKFVESRESRRRDRFELLATAAASEAVAEAGLEISEVTAARIGVVVSSAIGGLRSLEEAVLTVHTDGPRRVSPFMIPMLMANGASGLIAIDHGIKGPCFSVASACASGADGIGMALLMLRSGMIDVALAGGSESTVLTTAVAAFDRVGAMSHQNDDYSMTPAPFDKNRDGLVMGEGAAVIVLEREAAARKRGATIYAELAGYGSTADAFHVTAPHAEGEGGSAAIRQALESAGAAPEDVGYINAHGTATQLNDVSETKAIKRALGSLAGSIPVSSTKSMTGHMMGATGALEAIFCALAIRDGVLPPTIHYRTPDPECDLNIIANEAREVKVDLALSNAFGFGGHNAVLALRRFS
ncbi:MAG TPA: beta-ketoacyl-ACP synthase II [Anaerolineales bacterium]|nr:beta-ketoacyl-ACP synthase II [Anaerolineales bacterium]